jgi:hypothetical protein
MTQKIINKDLKEFYKEAFLKTFGKEFHGFKVLKGPCLLKNVSHSLYFDYYFKTHFHTRYMEEGQLDFDFEWRIDLKEQFLENSLLMFDKMLMDGSMCRLCGMSNYYRITPKDVSNLEVIFEEAKEKIPPYLIEGLFKKLTTPKEMIEFLKLDPSPIQYLNPFGGQSIITVAYLMAQFQSKQKALDYLQEEIKKCGPHSFVKTLTSVVEDVKNYNP